MAGRGVEVGDVREEVTGGAGTVGDEGEDLGDQALLDRCILSQ